MEIYQAYPSMQECRFKKGYKKNAKRLLPHVLGALTLEIMSQLSHECSFPVSGILFHLLYFLANYDKSFQMEMDMDQFYHDHENFSVSGDQEQFVSGRSKMDYSSSSKGDFTFNV